MQINIYQLVQKNKRWEKFAFMETTNWIVLAAGWSVKYFFGPNSPIFRKSRRGKKTNSKAIAKRFALQANADIIFHNTC